MFRRSEPRPSNPDGQAASTPAVEVLNRARRLPFGELLVALRRR
jgi:hypothetical protein